jgi:hypothetical protein
MTVAKRTEAHVRCESPNCDCGTPLPRSAKPSWIDAVTNSATTASSGMAWTPILTDGSQ